MCPAVCPGFLYFHISVLDAVDDHVDVYAALAADLYGCDPLKFSVLLLPDLSQFLPKPLQVFFGFLHAVRAVLSLVCESDPVVILLKIPLDQPSGFLLPVFLVDDLHLFLGRLFPLLPGKSWCPFFPR